MANVRMGVLAVVVLSACVAPTGGHADGGVASTGSGQNTGTGGGLAGTGGGTGGGTGASTCRAGDLLQSLGHQKLLVGASMTNAIAARAPFTLRYQYLAGGLAPGTAPCSTCDAACGGDWWGCWQDTSLPPGEFVRRFVADAKARGMIPMITYYLVLVAADWSEGEDEVTALNDAARATRIFNDLRFMLQQVGAERALVHLEPDFWGYAQRVNADPSAIPAKVKLGNPTDCADEPDTFVGLGRCFTRMVRRYAPNAKVGLHASAWSTGQDVFLSKDAALDVAAEAAKTARFLSACAPDADFIALDASDRDASWYQQVQGRDTWWDATNAQLPNFRRAFTWARALADAADKPVLWWQLPVGHAGLDDTRNRYRDNRVEYFFAHPDEVAASGALGFAFGAGESAQTSPMTDDDFLVGRVQALSAAGGQAPCP